MATTFTLEIASGYAANTPHKIQVVQGTTLVGTATATVSTVGSAKFVSASITLSGHSAGLVNVSSYDGNDTLTNSERYTINASGVVLDGDVSADTAAVAAAVLAAGNIDGYTLEESQKLLLAAFTGVLSGGGTTENVIKAADGSKTRITGTVDSNGNRTAVVLDAT